MVTFEVSSDLEPAYLKFPPYYGLTNPKEFFESRRVKGVEASGGAPAFAGAISEQGLLGAIHESFSTHLPLVISPDDVWLTISHGLAKHVVMHAEELRSRFVSFEGKETLVARRDTFIKGSPDNDWPGVWEEFSQKIRERTVPKTYERIICDFSTTGLLEKAISNLTLMDAMSEYFSYGVMTCCGIPKVTLLGEPGDWEKVYNKASALAEYDLGWWTKELLPVLEQFKLASQGKPDVDWWKSLYKYFSMSGGDSIDGHIVALFPYVKGSNSKNKTVEYLQRTNWTHMTSSEVPSATLKVPFTWLYHGEAFEMFFRGGLCGVVETEQGLKAACFWGVSE